MGKCFRRILIRLSDGKGMLGDLRVCVIRSERLGLNSTLLFDDWARMRQRMVSDVAVAVQNTRIGVPG